MKNFYDKGSPRTSVRRQQLTLFDFEAFDIENYQSRSTKIGAEFENCCNTLLHSIGFQLQGKTTFSGAGIEVDQIVRNRNGILFYFEFKGSRDGERPGLIRTDNTKKALCNAFLLDRLSLRPFVIMTSHKPLRYSASFEMLRSADDVVFDVICLRDHEDIQRLKQYIDFDNTAIAAREEEKRQRVIEDSDRRRQSPSFFSIWDEDQIDICSVRQTR